MKCKLSISYPTDETLTVMIGSFLISFSSIMQFGGVEHNDVLLFHEGITTGLIDWLIISRSTLLRLRRHLHEVEHFGDFSLSRCRFLPRELLDLWVVYFPMNHITSQRPWLDILVPPARHSVVPLRGLITSYNHNYIQFIISYYFKCKQSTRLSSSTSDNVCYMCTCHCYVLLVRRWQGSLVTNIIGEERKPLTGLRGGVVDPWTNPLKGVNAWWTYLSDNGHRMDCAINNNQSIM